MSRLIDELQTAIKSNRGHLSKLGPQLQAEQEQFSSYVYQHIKSLPANTLIPGGLQLKVGVILGLTLGSARDKTLLHLKTLITIPLSLNFFLCCLPQTGVWLTSDNITIRGMYFKNKIPRSLWNVNFINFN